MNQIILTQQEIESALSDLIEGKSVKRSKFSLIETNLFLADQFKNLLQRKKYFPHLLQEIQLQHGFRFPAFFIDEKVSVAYFGWIVWEKFHYLKHRKIWISEQKDLKGDWELYFEENDGQIFWVNQSISFAMEMDKLIPW